MNSRSLISWCGALVLSACATMTPPYTEIPAGPVSVGGLQLAVDAGWNRPTAVTKGAVYWTRDGAGLDRIVVFPDIGDGQSLLPARSKSEPYPSFRATMLPNEIVALVESTLSKSFGEGETLVTSSGLRPQTFGGHKGFGFDLALSFSDGPDQRGLAGGFVADGKLELVVYLGAIPYYYDLHRERAARIIESTRLAAAP